MEMVSSRLWKWKKTVRVVLMEMVYSRLWE